MTTLSQEMRARVLETLSLIASEEAQQRYQREAPSIDVPAELFNQWDDCFFPDNETFRTAFSVVEMEALNRFDHVLNQVSNETPQQLPALHAFMTTASWRRLVDAAQAALATFAR